MSQEKIIEEFELSNDQKNKIIDVIVKHRCDPYESMAPVLNEVLDRVYRILPSKLIHALTTFRFLPLSLLMIHNSPYAFDNDPGPTPLNDNDRGIGDYVSEVFLAVVFFIMGARIFTNKDEKNGMPFQNVFQDPSKICELSGAGSKRILPIHTENVHQSHRPHVFGLQCKKGDINAKTGFLGIESINDGLPTSIIEGMKKKQFNFYSGPTYQKEGIGLYSILEKGRHGHPYFLRIHMDESRMVGINDEAVQVLTYLRARLEKIDCLNKYEWVFEPGMCAIVTNLLGAHYRHSYDPSYAHVDDRRWLVRAYARFIDWSGV